MSQKEYKCKQTHSDATCYWIYLSVSDIHFTRHFQFSTRIPSKSTPSTPFRTYKQQQEEEEEEGKEKSERDEQRNK